MNLQLGLFGEPRPEPAGATTKRCAHCLGVLPLEAFCSDRSQEDGRQSACWSCQMARQVRRNYQVELSVVVSMLEAQGGLCAICDKSIGFMRGRASNAAHIDHDHASGRVRGILCQPCNVRLAHIENERFLTRALQYLGLSPIDREQAS